MLDIRIILSGTWISLFLVYLFGDVLRIFSGDYKKSDMAKKMNQAMWLGISMLMLVPILMVLLSLVLPYEVNRIANIVIAGFFFLFNLVGLPSYPSVYDKFLIVVGLVFNVVTIVYALNW